MNTTNHKGDEIAATDTNSKPVPADGYTTRDERPARREDRNHPDGDNGGYDHREIAPRDRRDIPPPPRAVCLSFREADFAARPPCYR